MTNPSRDPTMECFDQNPLRFANGRTIVQFQEGPFVNPPPTEGPTREFKVQLPANMVCNHCLFQVQIVINFHNIRVFQFVFKHLDEMDCS